MHKEDVFIMGKRTRYNFNLLLLLTAGILAIVFSNECAQAKVKTTIKNGVCIVSGKDAMTDDYGYNKEIKKVIIKDGVTSLPEEAFHLPIRILYRNPLGLGNFFWAGAFVL